MDTVLYPKIKMEQRRLAVPAMEVRVHGIVPEGGDVILTPEALR